VVGGPYKGGNYPASYQVTRLCASHNEQFIANMHLTEFEHKAAKAATKNN